MFYCCLPLIEEQEYIIAVTCVSLVFTGVDYVLYVYWSVTFLQHKLPVQMHLVLFNSS